MTPGGGMGETMAVRIGFIGMGRMATALATRLLGADVVAPSDVRFMDRLTDPHPLESDRGVGRMATASDLWTWADVVVLAVKPQQLADVAASLAGSEGRGTLVVSILAGTRLATLRSALPAGARLVRAMPNTPALVGEGVTGWVAGPACTPEDRALVSQLLGAVGYAVELDKEPLLDAVCGLSGSGPAYVFLFIEALADGGVRGGLPRSVALELAARTVAGAARLCVETAEHPGVLKDQVTSPAGTTIEGVAALEAGGFRGAVMAAVAASTERSRDLG